MRITKFFQLFTGTVAMAVALALAACGTSPVNKNDYKPAENTPPRVVERPPTSEFIRDRAMRLEGEGANARYVDSGPLLGYKIRLNYALNPDKSAPVREGKLIGEAVVFGVPDGKGDTGASFQIAFDRAAELFERGALPQIANDSEHIAEGTIALVKLETPGYPSGQRGGTVIPVVMIPLGNARSVIGGHIYATELVDNETGDKLAYCDYTQLWDEEIVSHERYFKDRNLRTVFDPDDTLGEAPKETAKEATKEEPDPAAAEGEVTPLPAKEERVIRRFIIQNAFKLLRSTGWKDAGRDEIALHLGWDRPEILEGVYDALLASAELSKKSAEFRVTRDPISATTLYVVPSLREGSIQSFYDDIRTLFFEIKPRNQMDILIDDSNGRILIVGPEARRRILRDFDFGLKRRTIKDYQPTGNFRVVGKVSDDKTKIDLTWSRLNGTTVLDKGEVTLENDFGNVLRYVYDKGLSVNDATVMVLEATELRYVNARLVRQQEVMRVKIEDIASRVDPKEPK